MRCPRIKISLKLRKMQQQPPQFFGGVQRWPGTASMQDVLAPSQEYLMRQLAATASMISDDASMPVLAACTPMSVATASICPAMMSGGIS
jgi:hypothetical protein